MKIYEYIKDNSLLIVPSHIKNSILNYLSDKDIFKIKIMSLNEFYDSYFFSYDKETLIYVCDHYNLVPSVGELYLKNLRYVEDKKYNVEILDKLVSIKKDLDSHNLLKYDNTFKVLLEKYQIVVDYPLSEFDKKIFNKLNSIIIEEDKEDNKDIDLYTFNNVNEEVEFVINRIIELNKNGIDLSNIFINNITGEYKNTFSTYSKLYNININMNESYPLYGTYVGKKVIEYLDEVSSKEELISKFKVNSKELDRVIGILNNYSFTNDISIIKDYVIEDIKNTNIKLDEYDNAINTCELDDLDQSKYVFIVGFNTSIPHIYKDEDFLSDNVKSILGLDTSIELNNKERVSTINEINSLNNVIITYSSNGNEGEYYLSNLVEDLSINKKEADDRSVLYSKNASVINLSRMLDNYRIYGEYDNKLMNYYTLLGKSNYDTYSNKFTGINKDKLREYIHNNLVFSYSSMNNYYLCSFRYYLNNILKLNIYESTFFTDLGNIFHEVLSHMYNEDFDFDKEYELACSKYEYGAKELFFINKLKDDLLFIINTIKEQDSHNKLKNVLCEDNISIDIKDNIKFTGFIDKLIYGEKDDLGRTPVAIIDYKTGRQDIDVKYAKYGLKLQLPVYLYLVEHSNIFNHPLYVGFYLQKILNNEINIVPKKTYEELKKENLKLVGYTNDNESTMSYIDDEYEDSSIIKGLKKTSKGTFNAYSKLKSDKEIDELIKIVEDKIEEAGNNIFNAEFTINPKNVDGELMGCEYCPFRGICYKTDSDTTYIVTKEVGDEDEMD